MLIFPRRREGDKWIVQWPFPDDKKMTGFAPEQVGAFARLVFRDPEAWNGAWHDGAPAPAPAPTVCW